VPGETEGTGTGRDSVRRSERVAYTGSAGIRLAGEAWGEPTDPPVLLLHGGGQTRHSWGGTARALAAAGAYAVALDHRGHGESEWAADGDYSLVAFAEDLAAVAATFDRPVAVVGASLGGSTALLAAAEIAGFVASALVLVDITPRMETAGAQRVHAFMNAYPDGFASLEEAADVVEGYRPGRPRPAVIAGLRKNLRCGADGRYRWHWDPRFITERGPAELVDHERMLRAARQIRAPALLVRGRLSDVVSMETAREFLDACPGAEFADVSDAGHMVAGDRNDAFTRTVCEFLSRVVPLAGAGSACGGSR